MMQGFSVKRWNMVIMIQLDDEEFKIVEKFNKKNSVRT